MGEGCEVAAVAANGGSSRLNAASAVARAATGGCGGGWTRHLSADEACYEDGAQHGAA